MENLIRSKTREAKTSSRFMDIIRNNVLMKKTKPAFKPDKQEKSSLMIKIEMEISILEMKNWKELSKYVLLMYAKNQPLVKCL